MTPVGDTGDEATDERAAEPAEPAERSSLDQLAIDFTVACARLTRASSQGARSDEPAAVWRALSILEQFGPMRVGDFAVLDHCSQPTATMMLRRLERAGSAQRSADPQDGRAALLSLTDHGRQKLAALRQGLVRTMGPRLSTLSSEEAEVLARAVPVIRKLIQR